jgi:CheY-like chemotaxis protein
MPHAFDGQRFALFVDDVWRIARGARHHERRLTNLVSAMEGPDPTATSRNDAAMMGNVADGGWSAFDGVNEPDGLLSNLRDLCIAAREQRQVVEALAMSLAGETDDNGAASARKHALVVDDTEDSRALAADVLELAGFHVTTAANGLDGVFVAHYARPDVILMDITMPVLNGLEAARLLKASPVTRDIHVLAYTAKPDFCDGPLRELFIDVLIKPAHPDAIAQRVRRAVDGSNRRRP